MPHGYTWLTTAIPIAVQFVVFLRWLHRRMRSDEITRAFVRDIVTNHLPHIYNALQNRGRAGNCSRRNSDGPLRRPQPQEKLG